MRTDFLIIGGGIIGLTVARALKQKHPNASIALADKEPDVARHASGRNSGVLHAGFYYGADSLKARFCRDGNKLMREYCAQYGLPLLRCGKLVVAASEAEIEGVHELKRRGDANSVEVELVDEKQTAQIEPHARTHGLALWSPTTAVFDPVAICEHLKERLQHAGVRLLLNHPYRGRRKGGVGIGDETIEAGVVINCAGTSASDIAQAFGFAKHYAILPFKGVYLEYTGNDTPLRTLIYGVPDMRKPFLGVQFSLTTGGGVRIGPTAIPAYWREHYGGFANFNVWEMAEILRWQATLFATNAFGFREFAFEEMKKYRKGYLRRHAFRMVQGLEPKQFNRWSRPGIRAQLLDMRTRLLVQDFIVEGDGKSIHVLNAVSPAFTSSLAFADWLVSTL